MAIEVKADTFPQLLLQHAQRRGERPAIREKRRGIWHTLNWRELADEVAALAAALAANGLQRGAHVAIVGDNRPRLYIAMCAAQTLGAVAMPLYQDASAEELIAPLQNAAATHVFAENQEQVDKLLKILPQCPSIRHIIYNEDRGMRHYRHAELKSYAALREQGRGLLGSNRDFLQAETVRGNGRDAAFLFYTSGATGPAKGVVLSYDSLIDRARVAAAADQLHDGDVAMAYLPLGWIGQTLFSYVQPMVVGYCVCCPESSDTFLADMREIGPSYFLAPPRVLETLYAQIMLRLEDAGRFNRWLYRRCMVVAQRAGARILSGERVGLGTSLSYKLGDWLMYGPLRDVLGMSRIRVAYTAGDAVDPNLLMFFRFIGVNLKQLYGSTETGFFVAMQRDGHVKPQTVGPAADGVELRFTEEGEILVRSPGLFREYHHDRNGTAQALSDEGWFRTGDAGCLDDDGHLLIIDRLKNVGALSDGTPHAPKLIENKLKFFPYIREAVAFGNGRDKVCVFIDIDPAAVGRWADRQTLNYTGHADLASLDQVYELIAGCIAKANSEVARDPVLSKVQIHRFVILPKPLDADDGVLTRTGKLRRGVIAERYGDLIAALYQNQTGLSFEGAQLKICDVKISPEARRAA